MRLLRHRPVVHLGQAAAVDAVRAATPGARWVVVSVWCDRDEALRRIEARATGDTAARLQAWSETEQLTAPDLTIDTAATNPRDAAQAVHQHVSGILVGVPIRP